MIDLKQYVEDNRIVEMRSGSHLYGLNTEDSDEDFVGIFLPPEEYVLGLKNVNEIDLSKVEKDASGKNTKDSVDRKLYEFRKFINLALANNPNILELLFTPEDNITYINTIGERLLAINHLFPSKLCADKFVGYAKSQKHKMVVKRDHFNELRQAKSVLESLEPKLTMAEVYNCCDDQYYPDPTTSKRLFWKKVESFHVRVADLCFEPGIYVKKALKKINGRLDKVTNRSELVLKHGLDVKFASHLIRLLSEGLFLLDYGYLEFPLPNKEELLDIKLGKWSLDEILERSSELETLLDESLARSKLPKTPYYNEIEVFTIEQMREYLFGRS